MAQQKGVTSVLQMGFESTFGTVATDGFTLPINTADLKGTQTLNSAATLSGTRNPVQPFAGNRDVNGNIVIPADSVAMWYWLKGAFGAPGTTGADPYVHEFKIGDTQPSMSIEYQFTDLATDKYVRMLGCKMSGFSMSFGGDGELISSLSILGASDSIESSSFDAAPAAVSIARVENFQTVVLEGGSTLSNATELSVEVDFGLDADQFVIGSDGVRGALPEGIVAVSGNLKTLLEDTTLLDKAIAGTETSLKATVTASASSIFELELQELRYERNTPDIPGPNGLLVDLNFQAFYDNGSEASAIVVRLTNSEAHA